MRTVTSNAARKPSFLVYGPAGSGKSYAATTFSGGPIHLLQTEPGRISALDHPGFRQAVENGTHKVFVVEKAQDLEIIRRGGYEAFCRQQGVDIPAMVVLDSISWYNTMVMEQVLQQYPPRNAAGIPEMQHWLIVTEQTKQLVNQLVCADTITYIIAQAEVREFDEPTGKINMWAPGLAGKYASQIAHTLDMVFFARPSQQGKHQLFCHPSGAFVAKTRGVTITERTIPFDIDGIVQMWNKTLSEKGGS